MLGDGRRSSYLKRPIWNRTRPQVDAVCRTSVLRRSIVGQSNNLPPSHPSQSAIIGSFVNSHIFHARPVPLQFSHRFRRCSGSAMNAVPSEKSTFINRLPKNLTSNGWPLTIRTEPARPTCSGPSIINTSIEDDEQSNASKSSVVRFDLFMLYSSDSMIRNVRLT
jgi:hypothetical protein